LLLMLDGRLQFSDHRPNIFSWDRGPFENILWRRHFTFGSINYYHALPKGQVLITQSTAKIKSNEALKCLYMQTQCMHLITPTLPALQIICSYILYRIHGVFFIFYEITSTVCTWTCTIHGAYSGTMVKTEHPLPACMYYIAGTLLYLLIIDIVSYFKTN
jgi:hypothetical protein